MSSDATDARVDTTASISTRVITGSVLYNILIARNAWAHLKLGGGSTNYGDAASRGLISGSSGTLMAGAGLRMGITPDLFARGDLTLTRNSSDTSDVSFTNFGVSLGSATCWEARPSPTATATASSRTRTLPRHSGRRPGGRDRLPERQRRRRRARRGGPLRQHGPRRGGGRDGLHPGLGQRQHPRRARPLPGHRVGRPGRPERLPTDSDGDAIPDGLDRCSETPKGATVDALGCPGDEDGDGVLDGLDRCPRTPTGTSINAAGCPTTPGAAPSGGSAACAAACRTPTQGARGAGSGGGRCCGGSSATRQPTSRRSGERAHRARCHS